MTINKALFTLSNVSPGTSIQDLGRKGGARLGVTPSGAADQFSFRLANLICQNPTSSPVIETTFGQLSLIFEEDCQFVITGANCHATLNSQAIGNQAIDNNRLIDAHIGDKLELGYPKEQVYSYVAIARGFECKYWLSSASQATSDIHLDMTTPALAAGQKFTFNPCTQSQLDANNDLFEPTGKLKALPNHFHQQGDLTLRFIPNNLWHQLTKIQQAHFLHQSFAIDSLSSRMGYRFIGEGIDCSPTQNLSMPVVYGAIQILPSGLPIVLMKEHQTMGGYPVIGHIYHVDLFRLAQKRPGGKVNFSPGCLKQAQAQMLAFANLFEA